MKRRRFQSIALIPKCEYVAICEEGRGWVFTFDDPKWRMLLQLPPIEEPPNAGLVTREESIKDYDRRHGADMGNLPDSFLDPSLGQPWPEDQVSDRAGSSSEPVACQGLGRQDLPIRDWANLAGRFDQAETLLINSVDGTNIDAGHVLLSLIYEIHNQLGLPRPGKAAQ